MAEDARYTHPLMGVVICCTSISPEIRSDLSTKATAMGAIHRQDLTSDVTHLIVGDINTPKYKYVAKNRLDVKVVDTAWVTVMHESWIAGEDIKVTDYEKDFRLPPFFGLRISVTNIVDNDERSAIMNLVISHGAEYHPDLTRKVTHLIAALPDGRKYEFARQWEIKIVSPHWLFQSIRRGMALDEKCYDPVLPKEKIGLEAMPMAAVAVKSEDAGKSAFTSRTLAEDPSQTGRRKLREDVTKKIEGHSQSIWDDIMSQASNTKTHRRDEWDESRECEPTGGDNVKVRRKRRKIEDDEDDQSNRDGGEEENTLGPLAPILPLEHADEGMFNSKHFCIYGFDEDKVGILRAAIESHSGLIRTVSELRLISPKAISYNQIYVVVPELFPKSSYPVIPGGLEYRVVSYWWIERCIHTKKFHEVQHPDNGGSDIDIFCFPFDLMPLKGFKGKEIVLTGFTGVNLMHISKAIKLSGAKYKESVNAKRTSLVISANDSAKTDKAQAALNWNISVVTIKWLVICIGKGEWIEPDNFLVQGVRRRARSEGDEERKQPLKGEIELKKNKSAIPSNSMKEVNLNLPTVLLDGCVIAVSKLIQSCDAELKLLAISLGARVVDNFPGSDIEHLTHFIHTTENPGVILDDYKAAKVVSGCHIISPAWLHKCQELKVRVDEIHYSLQEKKVAACIGSTLCCDPEDPSGKQIVEPQLPSGGNRKPSEIGDSEAEDSDAEDLEDLGNKNLHIGPPDSPALQNTAKSDSLPVVNKPILTDFLKFGIDKLSTVLDKPRKTRGRLQGKATSNMCSRENSTTAAENGNSESADLLALRNRTCAILDTGGRSNTSYFTQVLPQSQSVSYEDAEAQMERKKIMAKLDGVEAMDTSPNSIRGRGAVVQDASRVRRSARNHQEHA